MSVKLMGKVWELDIDTPQQIVLLALADHADDDGNNVKPSIGRIAWKTNYSVRTIQRIMRALRTKKVLFVSVAASRRSPTIYRLDLSNLPLKAPYRRGVILAPMVDNSVDNSVDNDADEESSGVPSATFRGAKAMASRGAKAMAPESSLTVSMNHQKTARNPSGDSSDRRLKNRQEKKTEASKAPWGEVFARLYLSDQRRFAKLSGWIDSKRRTHRYADTEIAAALARFEAHDKSSAVDNWWPYLDILIDRHTAKNNAREFEGEHERRKGEEREWAKGNLLGI